MDDGVFEWCILLTFISLCVDANLFKDAFLKAQKENEELFKTEEAKEEAKEE